jgi:molecular chaperone GrpE
VDGSAGTESSPTAEPAPPVDDALLRLRAEFANYRTRSLRTQQEAVAAAGDRLVTSLLPALDAFFAAEHSLATATLTTEGKGLLAAATLLESVLSSEGLTRIGEPGELFDVEIHEAVEHIDTQSSELHVANVLRPGWVWRGRTLRPAMVRVTG